MIPIRDTIPSRRAPVVTWTLIAVNVIVFVYEIGLRPEALERFTYLFGLIPARYTHPRWAHWVGFPVDDYSSLVTCMFLHGSWLHVIGNMWTLWIFGDNVEDRMGRPRFLGFYLTTGLVAGLTHLFMNLNSKVPTLGASGAIAGVLGAYFVLFPTARVLTIFPILFWPLFLEIPAVVYLFFWFITQVFGGTLAGLAPGAVQNIAFWAHVGGFVSGALLCWVFLLPRGREVLVGTDSS